MECLDNIIGIRGCGADESGAQLFINDLPGVSLQNIDALVDEEDETFLALWSKVSLRAMRKFDLLVKAQLNKCYKITDNTVVSCLICEKKELFYVAMWYLFGTELMIERTSSDTISRFTTIDLDKAEQLKGEFYAEFQSFLSDAIDSINPEDSDCVTSCVECNDSIRFVMQTP